MNLRTLIIVAAILACALHSVTRAEEIHRRLRLSVMLGGHNAQGEIRSEAANILTLIDDAGAVVDRFLDPRDDATIFGNFEIKPASVATLSLQYGVTRFFLVEGSIAYSRADIGEVEVQEIFSGAISRITVGELTRIPFQLSGLFRFRPEAKLNPYIGAGIGYTVVGQDLSDDFNALSLNLDQSVGRQARLESERFGSSISFFSLGGERELAGASIDIQDTFEWHLAGGLELTFAKNWSVVADLRYNFASRQYELSFNDSEPVGIAVPNATDFIDSEAATKVYGPLVLVEGGLLDINGDGEIDTGGYYVQGGKLSYDGIQAQIGVRYSF